MSFFDLPFIGPIASSVGRWGEHVWKQTGDILDAGKNLGLAVGNAFQGKWSEAGKNLQQVGDDIVDAGKHGLGAMDEGLEVLSSLPLPMPLAAPLALANTAKNVVKGVVAQNVNAAGYQGGGQIGSFQGDQSAEANAIMAGYTPMMTMDMMKGPNRRIEPMKMDEMTEPDRRLEQIEIDEMMAERAQKRRKTQLKSEEE